MTEADASALVTNDDEGSKAEATATLHHFGDAVNMHQTIDKLAIALVSIFVSCHDFSPLARLKGQTGFASRFGQGFDAPVINITATVENNGFDTGLFGPFSDLLANNTGGVNIATGLAGKIFVFCRS
jgi:hypothetical protein